ncbi:MAG: hypothetical protein ACK55S_11745, partial [Planctomycetota bacterium]
AMNAYSKWHMIVNAMWGASQRIPRRHGMPSYVCLAVPPRLAATVSRRRGSSITRSIPNKTRRRVWFGNYPSLLLPASPTVL